MLRGRIRRLPVDFRIIGSKGKTRPTEPKINLGRNNFCGKGSKGCGENNIYMPAAAGHIRREAETEIHAEISSYVDIVCSVNI